MRFIYIDSHGKEVAIPTVDALALRIELGAITESTRLYDEAGDRWAPAREHEIFRTLQREREEKSGGFVAPPPPASVAPPAAAPPQSPVPPAPAGRARNPFEALDGPGGLELAPPEPPPSPPAPSAGKKPGDDSLGGLDFDLTFDAPTAPPDSGDRAEPEGFGADAAGGGPGFDALELDASAAEPSAPPPGGKKEKPEKRKEESFDFGGFGGLLTDDDDDDEDEARPPLPAPPSLPDHGMIVEDVLTAAGYDQPAGQGAAVVGGGIDLEQPLSELPVDHEGWTPRERMTMDSDEPAPTGEETRRPERAPRPRAAPAPTPEHKASPLPALIGAVVVLAVVGGGGWFGWTKIEGRRAAAAAAAAAAADPPVAIPAIAAELEPRMRALADSAQADWLEALRTQLPAEHGVPPEPDGDWLAGIYLAGASNYPIVVSYWKALDGYLGDAEAHDVETFAALYQARLDSAGVSGADAQAMLERARAGFLAGRTERRAVYGELRDIIQSALGLHEFLLANQSRIKYDPAAGGASKDPVLEAVPETPELGEDMWARVDKITQSLDALGALDKVTTDRLLTLFTDKLRAVTIR